MHATRTAGTAAMVLRIGMQRDLTGKMIGDWIRDFRTALPDTAFYIEADYSPAMTSDLLVGAQDFAMMFTPRMHPDLYFETLGEIPYRMISTDVVSLADVEPDRYILTNFSPAFAEAHALLHPSLAGAWVSSGESTTIAGLLTSIGGSAYVIGEMADELVPYVKKMGFTHIELLPIAEHPFDGSWGYQPIGLFAPTSRHGSPREFAAFVDACHRAGLGVLLDWVPGHFPTDAHGLGRFDGTALYEHADPRQGFHQDWSTFIYNFGRTEVANFLHANALFWLDRYHVDGLRVDAVASMLYLDYSRKADEWVPNKFGGRENLEAVDFLRRMNELTYGEQAGTMTVAEESTAWPAVSRPTWAGGLGFGYKWNMGWMHDTLDYMGKDPAYRRWHHHQMTFGLLYAFSENFVLPLSHDEVVHGKGSILARMPGDAWQQFANLRAYYGFMWGHPGKKLLFMGQEFAQGAEWNHDGEIDWAAIGNPLHYGVQMFVRDLNRLYRTTPALYAKDCDPAGFQWIEANDVENSVFAWIRRGNPGDPEVVVICNFTPVERSAYRLGLPQAGVWREALNSDAEAYGGGGRGNLGSVAAVAGESHGQPAHADVVLPPLSTLILIKDDLPLSV